MDFSRMEFLKSCLEKDGEDSFVRFALAKEYENGGQLEEAVRQYLILEQNDPDYIGLYYHLGHAYAELGKLEEALMTFDRGIEVARKMHDQHALSELLNARTNVAMGL